MRRGFSAVLVTALVLAAAGEAAEASTPARHAWVQGDSVLAGAVDEVEGALADWDVTVGAFVGLSIRQATQVLRDRERELGSVVVVELGLNEWGLAPEVIARQIDDLVAVVGDRHVIWLTGARFRPEVDRVNGEIRSAAARHDDFTVVEWGPLSDAHPEATYGDRIHLRPAGERLLAETIRGALEAWWDGRCALDDTARTNSVARLYRAYFLRDADEAGIEYWTEQHRSGDLCLPDISEAFAGSPEFVARYGELDLPEFVRLVYANVLGREPDPDGYEYWAGLLAAGLRRGEVMLAFAESPEFRATTGIP